MDFGAGLPQFSSVSDEKCNHCVLTVTLRQFSAFKNHGESEFTDYVTDDEDFKVCFLPKFYANGNCSENAGYVSIFLYGGEILSFIIHFTYIEFNTTVAVVDAAGNKRFIQTFAYIYDPNSPCGLENSVPKFGIEKYVKRDTLLSEPSEFLPGDTLTICMEIDYLIRVFSLDFSPCIIQDTFVKDGDKHYFNLDSSFGQELCKVCDYFRCLSDTPMIESKTRRAYIPSEELKAFQCIHLILTGDNELKVESMSDISQLYIVSDKYDIQPVIETCQQLVKSFFVDSIHDEKVLELATENISTILELAEAYRDKVLKETVEKYLEIKEKFEDSVFDFEEHLKNALKTEWSCEYEKIENSAYFKVSRIKRREKESQMEFYE